MLERTEFHLFPIAPFGGIGDKVRFIYQAERSDDLYGHLLHLQHRRHSGKRPLEDQVHQHRLNEVIPVMPQRDLVAPEFLRYVEQSFSSVPGT